MRHISPATKRLAAALEVDFNDMGALLSDAPVLNDERKALAPADPPPPPAPAPEFTPTACISSCRVDRKNVGPPTDARDGPMAALQFDIRHIRTMAIVRPASWSNFIRVKWNIVRVRW